jgi:hypothetical protein
MGKGTIGFVAALAFWAGGALSAEAQVIDVSSATPKTVSSGSATYTVTATVSGPATFNYRLLVYKGALLVFNSGWQAGSGTQISYPVCGLSRTVTDILQHKLTASCTGWTSDTEIWNVDVAYYGFNSLEESRPRTGAFREEALAWLDPKSLGVQA